MKKKIPVGAPAQTTLTCKDADSSSRRMGKNSLVHGYALSALLINHPWWPSDLTLPRKWACPVSSLLNSPHPVCESKKKTKKMCVLLPPILFFSITVYLDTISLLGSSNLTKRRTARVWPLLAGWPPLSLFSCARCALLSYGKSQVGTLFILQIKHGNKNLDGTDNATATHNKPAVAVNHPFFLLHLLFPFRGTLF